MKQMERLEVMVQEAWEAIVSENQARPVASGYQCVFLGRSIFSRTADRPTIAFFNHDVKRWTVDRLRALSPEISKVLIVPGTVLWAKDLYDPTFTMGSQPGHFVVGKALNQQRKQKAIARIKAAGLFGTEINQTGWSHTRNVGTDERKLAQNVAYICLTVRS